MKPSRIIAADGLVYVLDSTGFYKPYVEPEYKYPWRGYLWIASGLIGAAVIAAAVWWVA